MRHRITIQQPTETLDAYGEPIVTWNDYLVDEPASVLPVGGMEMIRGKQYEPSTTAVFTVRHRDGYDTKMRVKHEGKYYGIIAIRKLDGMDRYMELSTRAAGDL
jgi:SPP1 family predicted phage head-tail adaptor